MYTVNDEITAVLEAPTTSPWLRAALRSAIARDPAEAANDAERLAQLLAARAETMFSLEEWRQLSSIQSLPPLAPKERPLA